MKAAYYSTGGEIFIFKMNALTLRELTEAIIAYGKQKGFNVPKVKIIGIRPGEKFYEELMSNDEMNYVLEDEELYVIIPTSSKHTYLHFKPTRISSYRSDQVDRLPKEKIVSIINQIDIN